LFAPGDTVPEALDVITVSRVSARKRLDLMVRAMDRLWDLEPRREFRLVVVGAPITQADRDYAASLEQMIRGSRHPSRIVFAGHLSPVEIRERYRSAFVHLNLSGTGSMDKSVMESLAGGCPVLTSN
jgi:glycosyltransferase involved in cell wall biosynthesis